MVTYKIKIIIVGIVLLIALLLISSEVLYHPRINLKVNRQLVGPENKAVDLLWKNASLDEIKSTFCKTATNLDDIVWLGDTLLCLAVDERRQDVVEWLLKEGANPNGANKSRIPLVSAIDENDITMIRLLVNNGADIDYDTGDGITPRCRAIAP